MTIGHEFLFAASFKRIRLYSTTSSLLATILGCWCIAVCYLLQLSLTSASYFIILCFSYPFRLRQQQQQKIKGFFFFFFQILFPTFKFVLFYHSALDGRQFISNKQQRVVQFRRNVVVCNGNDRIWQLNWRFKVISLARKRQSVFNTLLDKSFIFIYLFFSPRPIVSIRVIFFLSFQRPNVFVSSFFLIKTIWIDVTASYC